MDYEQVKDDNGNVIGLRMKCDNLGKCGKVCQVTDMGTPEGWIEVSIRVKGGYHRSEYCSYTCAVEKMLDDNLTMSQREEKRRMLWEQLRELDDKAKCAHCGGGKPRKGWLMMYLEGEPYWRHICSDGCVVGYKDKHGVKVTKVERLTLA